MALPVVKPSKEERVGMALRAMTILDAINGVYRATSHPADKEAWIRAVYDHPQVRSWAGSPAPVVAFKSGTGSYKFGPLNSDGDLCYWFGRRAMTDTDLARAFACGARYAGWPDGSRKASGFVNDPQMAMLAVAALWVHSPVRAKELFDLLGALKVGVAAPAGGWDPDSWAVL